MRLINFVGNENTFFAAEFIKVFLVFIRQRLTRIKHMQNQLGGRHTFVTTPDALGLDGISGFAQAGGVDENHGDAAHVCGFLDRIARGAGGGSDNSAFMPEQLIEQAGLADIGPAYDCDYWDGQIYTKLRYLLFTRRTQFQESKNSKIVFWACKRLCAWGNATDCGCSSMPGGTSSP